jgi:hypothetical protein
MSDSKSNLIYIKNPKCGWCQKADPVIEEMRNEGIEINEIDVSVSENVPEAKEIMDKFDIRCGTPLFINKETGHNVCGFRGRDVLDKWVKGEDIPARPQRNTPPPQQQQQQQMDPQHMPMFIMETQRMRFQIYKHVEETMKDENPTHEEIAKKAESIFAFALGMDMNNGK